MRSFVPRSDSSRASGGEELTSPNPDNSCQPAENTNNMFSVDATAPNLQGTPIFVVSFTTSKTRSKAKQ